MYFQSGVFLFCGEGYFRYYYSQKRVITCNRVFIAPIFLKKRRAPFCRTPPSQLGSEHGKSPFESRAAARECRRTATGRKTKRARAQLHGLSPNIGGELSACFHPAFCRPQPLLSRKNNLFFRLKRGFRARRLGFQKGISCGAVKLSFSIYCSPRRGFVFLKTKAGRQPQPRPASLIFCFVLVLPYCFIATKLLILPDTHSSGFHSFGILKQPLTAFRRPLSAAEFLQSPSPISAATSKGFRSA